MTPALSRATVDRDAALRDDPAALDEAWAKARVLVVDDGTAMVVEPAGPAGHGPDGARPRLVLLPSTEAPGGDRLYLGQDADGPVFTVAGALPDQPTLPDRPTPEARPTGPHLAGPAVRRGLREVGALLDDHDAGLLVHAVGLTNWHATHPCCSRCGAPTRSDKGGSIRRCSADGSAHFPRTDPAVIMLVHDGADRCVLGRQAVWPPGRFSTLAGFVEPGESAEQAVVRETAEETGVVVEDVRYLGSQPWPFPSSLMLAFHARTDPASVPRPVDGELEDARWFTRDELRRARTWGAPQDGLQLPPRVSIAWLLITGWLDGTDPG